jgi:hypothetical protein
MNIFLSFVVICELQCYTVLKGNSGTNRFFISHNKSRPLETSAKGGGMGGGDNDPSLTRNARPLQNTNKIVWSFSLFARLQ